MDYILQKDNSSKISIKDFSGMSIHIVSMFNSQILLGLISILFIMVVFHIGPIERTIHKYSDNKIIIRTLMFIVSRSVKFFWRLILSVTVFKLYMLFIFMIHLATSIIKLETNMARLITILNTQNLLILLMITLIIYLYPIECIRSIRIGFFYTVPLLFIFLFSSMLVFNSKLVQLNPETILLFIFFMIVYAIYFFLNRIRIVNLIEPLPEKIKIIHFKNESFFRKVGLVLK